MPDQKKTWKRWMLLQENPRMIWGEPSDSAKRAWVNAAFGCGVPFDDIGNWIRTAKEYSKAVRVIITLER